MPAAARAACRGGRAGRSVRRDQGGEVGGGEAVDVVGHPHLHLHGGHPGVDQVPAEDVGGQPLEAGVGVEHPHHHPLAVGPLGQGGVDGGHAALSAAPLPRRASGARRVTTRSCGNWSTRSAQHVGVRSVEPSSTTHTWPRGRWLSRCRTVPPTTSSLVQAGHDVVEVVAGPAPGHAVGPGQERPHDEHDVEQEADAQQERGRVQRRQRQVVGVHRTRPRSCGCAVG